MGLCFSYSRREFSTTHHVTISAPTSTSAHKSSTFPTLDMTQMEQQATAVAVYCASSMGNKTAYQNAALSLGRALGDANRPLVYGGGSKGLMGVVSGGVLEKNGKVTGVVPYAMVSAGGEKEQTMDGAPGYGQVLLQEKGRELLKQGLTLAAKIVVDSMHQRKMEMAKRACAFVGLPGGYGTFEEVLEVVTWSQLGIHNKPILLVNVYSYWEPLRQLIRNGIAEGFISAKNEKLIQFVDGPADHAEHEDFDWGKATLEALDKWEAVVISYTYNWTKRTAGDVPKGEEITAI
ncbi:hypothetical protein EIP91_006943 [Steccherinum ochraceum]|uniref:Cytokinin riboside 5'-monophosphate phosphoribohydrolase n=1 Tax=Steccherinum ochraceum TaxID=92696 RepID=A0A4R0RD78_9APHY|nr:hypothetical protein EIP91_006943 [Steccherinum ochraceum]